MGWFGDQTINIELTESTTVAIVLVILIILIYIIKFIIKYNNLKLLSRQSANP